MRIYRFLNDKEFLTVQLSKQSYESIKNEMKNIEEYIAKLRDSKLADIKVDNNIGLTIETQTYFGSALNPKLKKIKSE